MVWTEGVLVVALVLVRLYSLGLEQARLRISAAKSEGDDARTVSVRWVQFQIAASVGAALLLGTASLLAAAGAHNFSAGVRVGLVLWATEVLVHLLGALELIKRVRSGAPVSIEAAFSLQAATWGSTMISVPIGALIGRWIGGAAP